MIGVASGGWGGGEDHEQVELRGIHLELLVGLHEVKVNVKLKLVRNPFVALGKGECEWYVRSI